MGSRVQRDLSADEFRRYQDFVRTRTGIAYPPEKLPLLSSRLRYAMRARGLADYDSYLAHLVSGRDGQALRQLRPSLHEKPAGSPAPSRGS